MTLKLRPRWLTGLACLVLVWNTASSAQPVTYSDKPVRLIVPQSPGSAGDIVARLLSQHLSNTLHQPFVVENRAGANGITAAISMAKEPPTGYTLMLGQVSQLTFNELLYKNVNYRGLEDFTYINPVVEANYVLVASIKSGIHSIADLKQRALAAPGTINYGSVGPGSMTHLSMALLANRLGIQLTHIPYKGTSPALISIESGETDVMVSVLGSVLPQIKARKVVPLAVLGAKRVKELPEVASIAETGIDLPVIPGWFVLVGPSGIPQNVVARLASATQDFLKSPDAVSKLGDLYLEPMRGTGEQMKQRAVKERALWGDFIRQNNIHAE